jgi:hypothetical protein
MGSLLQCGKLMIPAWVLGGPLWHCWPRSDFLTNLESVLARQMGVEQLKQFFHRRAAPHCHPQAQAWAA